MSEFSELRVEIPREMRVGFKELGKKEVNSLVLQALREGLAERLMFRFADKLLKKSEITDEMALKWGSELKARAANKQGS